MTVRPPVGGPRGDRPSEEGNWALPVDHRAQPIATRGATVNNAIRTQPDPGKMEAVERLAGVVAHDFNNTLMIINGFADMLGTGIGGENGQHQFVSEIMKATDKAASLCRTLARIAGRDAGEVVAVDLHALLDELRPEIAQAVGEGVRLRIECSPEVGIISANPDRLKQTITSVCLNAREATPDGGELTVEAYRCASDSSQGRGPAGAVVEVRDSGTGMSPETLRHIFEPFYTTKSAHEGLGLANAYEAMKRWGGRIECSSVLDAGTTVKLFFRDFEA